MIFFHLDSGQGECYRHLDIIFPAKVRGEMGYLPSALLGNKKKRRTGARRRPVARDKEDWVRPPTVPVSHSRNEETSRVDCRGPPFPPPPTNCSPAPTTNHPPQLRFLTLPARMGVLPRTRIRMNYRKNDAGIVGTSTTM